MTQQMTQEDREFFIGLPDRVLLSRMIWREAGNQSLRGQVAVACVPFNRLNHPRKRYGATLMNVLLRPEQFSCFNSDDPNYLYMLSGVADNDIESAALTRCFTLADLAVEGMLVDPTRLDGMTQGATHYHKIDTKPWWAPILHYLITIGDHRFYLEI